MVSGRIKEILISPSGLKKKLGLERAPMVPLEQVMAVAGMGLVGDRYYVETAAGTYSGTSRIPDADRQVTFISSEAIALANHLMSRRFTGADTRRNIVTEGVDWRETAGLVAMVVNPNPEERAAVFEVVEECEPCDIPDGGKSNFKYAYSKNPRRNEWRGGVRVRVLETGLVAVGWEVLLLNKELWEFKKQLK